MVRLRRTFNIKGFSQERINHASIRITSETFQFSIQKVSTDRQHASDIASYERPSIVLIP